MSRSPRIFRIDGQHTGSEEGMMKSALSLTLVASLAASTLPVAADENTPTAGPLARSMTREAARLSAVPGDRAPVVRLVPCSKARSRDTDSAHGQWIAAGLTLFRGCRRRWTGGAEPLRTDRSSSGASGASPRRVAPPGGVRHRGAGIQSDGPMTWGPDGVFVDGRKVADRSDIVQRIDRARKSIRAGG